MKLACVVALCLLLSAVNARSLQNEDGDIRLQLTRDGDEKEPTKEEVEEALAKTHAVLEEALKETEEAEEELDSGEAPVVSDEAQEESEESAESEEPAKAEQQPAETAAGNERRKRGWTVNYDSERGWSVGYSKKF